MTSKNNKKPLTGIKVIDFSRVFAGPYCSMLLGDLGAEVVKVEIPGSGDPLRNQGPPFHHGMGITYLAANRNKKSITIDMQTAEGKDLAFNLCTKADVLLENFRPDVMGRLGLDYDKVSKKNPKIIYASISGLGADGPDMNQGAFDLTIQALGGYMSITGERSGNPIKLGTSAFDIVSGMNCYSGILAALLMRKDTGLGQKVQTSLLESEVAFLTNAGMEYLITGNIPGKWGSEHPQQAPYKAFESNDGWIVIGAGYQNLFESFMKILNRIDLISDERFKDLSARVVNRDELYEIIDSEVKKHKNKELIEKLEAANVPCAQVNNMQEVFEHRQVLHRDMLVKVEHKQYGELPQIGASTKFSSFEITQNWTAPPTLGENNQEVLKSWLGLNNDEIAHLVKNKAI